jgi:hypothetical protein
MFMLLVKLTVILWVVTEAQALFDKLYVFHSVGICPRAVPAMPLCICHVHPHVASYVCMYVSCNAELHAKHIQPSNPSDL